MSGEAIEYAPTLKSWAEFCVIKMLADLAEIPQVEDLLQLRNLARSTMPDERFHADFGVQFCTQLCETPEGKTAVQAAINEYSIASCRNSWGCGARPGAEAGRGISSNVRQTTA